MVVCLRSEVFLQKGIKLRIATIFVTFLKHIFLKITVSMSLMGMNRPNKKFVLVAISLIFFFNYLSQKSCLFGQISPIFENMYHEN